MRGRTAFAATIVVGLLAAAPAGAATITVNTTTDELTPGAGCSLREAIATVDGSPDGDCGTASSSGNTIVLGASTYPLTLEKFLFIGGLPPGCISTFLSRPSDNSWGELSVAGTVQNLTIEGAGSARTVIDACRLGDRALQVMPGASVTLRHLTIANGNAQEGAEGTEGATFGSVGGAATPGASGGAILNEGNLTLTDTAVTNSHAGNGGNGGKGGPLGGSGGLGGDGGSGGGIASTGSLTLNETTISHNSAGNGGEGGEAIVGSTADAQSGNGGSGGSGGNGGGGGGIANEDGTVTLDSSTITANTSGAGGAGTSGQNSASAEGNGGNGGSGGSGGNGAGIASAGSVLKEASLQATNDTIQGNGAGKGADGGNPGSGANDVFSEGQGGNGGNGGYGGGLVNLLHATTQLVNLTIAENSAGTGGEGGLVSESHPGTNGSSGHGGGIYATTSPTLRNTILYEDQTGGDCRGTITDGGHNLVFAQPHLGGVVPDPCDLSGFSSGDPKLEALAEDGGPTQTMRLLAGSAAIDQVPASGASCPATDQRGVTRPGGAACDIGAYELSPPRATTGQASHVSANGATVAATVIANAAAATVQFQYGTSTAYGSSTAQQIAAGVTSVSMAAGLSSLSPGTTYHFRVIAQNPDGTSFGTDQTFTTPTSAASIAAPVITNVTQSHRRWREGRQLASFSRGHRRPPLGTVFSFTLNEPASVSFTFTQRVPGRKVNGRCAAPKRKNRHSRACRRTVTRGLLSFAGHAGTNRVSFQGRTSHSKKLEPGTYTLLITAAASGQQSAPERLSFTIVK